MSERQKDGVAKNVGRMCGNAQKLTPQFGLASSREWKLGKGSQWDGGQSCYLIEKIIEICVLRVGIGSQR